MKYLEKQGWIKDKGTMYKCGCKKEFFIQGNDELKCPKCGNKNVLMSKEDKAVYAQLQKRFTLPQLRRLMPKAVCKQFMATPLKFAPTNERVICQIKNCSEKMSWFTGDKKNRHIFLCFGHGEEL